MRRDASPCNLQEIPSFDHCTCCCVLWLTELPPGMHGLQKDLPYDQGIFWACRAAALYCSTCLQAMTASAGI